MARTLDSETSDILSSFYSNSQNYDHDINDKNIIGRTRLHEACILGDLKHAKYLVSKKADINAQDDDGFTPMMYAILAQNTEVLTWLVEIGAIKTLTSYTGFSPLRVAQLRAYEEAVIILSPS